MGVLGEQDVILNGAGVGEVPPPTKEIRICML